METAPIPLVVFAGPTISRGEVKACAPGAWVLGPVRRGAVYLAARREPRAIAIVDGHFDQTPAVWHKEILWALKAGIRVYGSSSMGALRAAELVRFGMIGVGRVFADVVSGTVRTEDEVVVSHAGIDDDWRPSSEALVNMRATFERAVDQRILSAHVAERLEDIARHTFFPERTYTNLLLDPRSRCLPQSELAAFREWLPRGHVDQKKRDALEMLRRIAQAKEEPDLPEFVFQETDSWLRLRAALDAQAATLERKAAAAST